MARKALFAILMALSLLASCRPEPRLPPGTPKRSVPKPSPTCPWQPLEQVLADGDLYHAARMAEGLPTECLSGRADRYAMLGELWYGLGDLEALGRLQGLAQSDPLASQAARESLSAARLQLEKEGSLEADPPHVEDVLRQIRTSRDAGLRAEANRRQSRAVWALERATSRRLGAVFPLAADPGPVVSSPSKAHWSSSSRGPVVGNGLEVAVLDLEERSIRWRFAVPRARLVDFALHPEEPRVASCWSDGSLRQWHLDTGRLEWEVPSPGCRNLVYRDDAGQLAVLGADTVDVLEGSPVHVHARTATACSAITWDHHGAVLCAEKSGRILRWKPGGLAEALPGTWPGTSQLDFRPGVDHLAVQARTTSTIVDYPSMALVFSARCSMCSCRSQRFAPDGTFVSLDECQNAKAYRPDGTAAWDIAYGGSALSFRPSALAFGPAGNELLFADSNGFDRNVAVGGEVQSDHQNWGNGRSWGGAAFGCKGGLWLTGAEAVFVPLGDSSLAVHVPRDGLGPVFAASADGRVLARAHESKMGTSRIRTLDIATGKHRSMEPSGSRGFRRRVLAAEGATLAALDATAREVRFWDVHGTQDGRVPLPRDVFDIALSADGSVLVTLGEDGIRWWHRDATGYRSSGAVALVPVAGYTDAIAAVSPDASRVVTVRRAGDVEVVSMQRRELGPVWQVEESVTAAAVDALGKWVAWGTRDGRVSLRSLDQGTVEATLQGHPGSVAAISFVSDPPLLVSQGSGHDATRLWNLADGSLVAEMRLTARFTGPLRRDDLEAAPPPWFAVAPVRRELLVEVQGVLPGGVLHCRIGDRVYPWGLCDGLLSRKNLVVRSIRGDESLGWHGPADESPPPSWDEKRTQAE